MRRALLALLLLVPAAAPVGLAHPEPPTEEPRALVVTWAPAAPREGDTVELRIAGRGTWPPPTCDIEQDGALVGDQHVSIWTGAEEDGEDYVCRFEVFTEGVLTMTVIDVEAGVYRVHGPHVVRTAAAQDLAIERLEGFALAEEVDEDGIVRASATAPLALWGVETPPVGDFGRLRGTTRASVSALLLPSPREFMMGYGGPADHTLPHHLVADLDIGWAYAFATERVFDPETDGFALVASMTARNEHAFGMSDADVEVYGTCALQKCLIVDS